MSADNALPGRPIDRVLDPMRRFLSVEASSGVLLLLVTAIALVLANTAAGPGYRAFVEERLVIGAGDFVLDYPLWYWVNDGLMVLFFFVIGLEIKRELVMGELADKRQAVLPVVAAVGGAALPAAIFLLVLGDGPGTEAWAVPMATDIAFVVGALALLGPRVPKGLKVFVLSLAIVDDLLAVLVIAFFYSEGIDGFWLGGAVGGLALFLVASRLGVRSIAVYVVLGIGVWLCTLKSGVHPTVAGVVLGLMTPATAWLSRKEAAEAVGECMAHLTDDSKTATSGMLAVTAVAAREAVSPLERLEFALHPWVAFLVMPIFAFVNAGVVLEGASIGAGVGLAVSVGLVVGKPIGIGLASFLAVKTGRASLPDGVTWTMLLATGLLAGVGFTMSLFVASLGLEGAQLASAKAGILIGSGVAMVLGLAILWLTLKRRAASK